MQGQFNDRQYIILESIKHISPCCGHDDFSALPTRFPWLSGKRFICAKCKSTFRTPNRVRFRPNYYVSLSRLG